MDVSPVAASRIAVPTAVRRVPGAPASAQQGTVPLLPGSTAADVEAAAKRLEQAASMLNRSLDFEVRAGSGVVVVHVIDTTTNEVIRSIPPEEAVALSERIEQFIGLLFDAVS